MRKTLKLPSGASCVVRALTGNDFLAHTGDVPIFHEASKATGNGTAGQSRDELREGVKLVRLCLLACCSPITTPEGKRLRIVDKDLDMARDGHEITIGEISDADATEIFNAVTEMSGIGKEAADAAGTFPQKQADAPAAGSDGGAVRNAAEPAPADVAG